MTDPARLAALHTAMAEARAVEIRESEKMVAAQAAAKAQDAVWKAANERYQAAKTTFERFAEEQALGDAKDINEEWRLD